MITSLIGPQAPAQSQSVCTQPSMPVCGTLLLTAPGFPGLLPVRLSVPALLTAIVRTVWFCKSTSTAHPIPEATTKCLVADPTPGLLDVHDRRCGLRI